MTEQLPSDETCVRGSRDWPHASTGPPLLLLTSLLLLLWCALAIAKAAPLQLPPLYEDLERQLVRHPWIGDRALGHLIDYARLHGAPEELRERWTSRTEGKSESAESYHLMLGALALEEAPERAWSHFEKGGETVYAHEARARWHVRHGEPEAAYRSLQEAQRRALSPSQWRQLTEALANDHFHRNDKIGALDVWRSAWGAQDDFAYRMEILPELWNWFNYLGETGVLENLTALVNDTTERTLLLAEAARLSGDYDRAERLLLTLADEKRQETRALLVEKRLAESLGADRQGSMLSARLAGKSAVLAAREIHGLIGLDGISNAVGPGITFAQRAEMRAFVNDVCSTYEHVFWENPFLALLGQTRHPIMDVVSAYAREHPDDLESNFVALELEVEALIRRRNPDPSLIERRDALVRGYQDVFEKAPRESSALRHYRATRLSIPAMIGDPWEKAQPFEAPTDLRQFAYHGPRDHDFRVLRDGLQRPALLDARFLSDASNIRWHALIRLSRLLAPEELLAYFETQIAETGAAVDERLLGYAFLGQLEKFLTKLAEHSEDEVLMNSRDGRHLVALACDQLETSRLSRTTAAGMAEALTNLHHAVSKHRPPDRWPSAAMIISALEKAGFAEEANAFFGSEYRRALNGNDVGDLYTLAALAKSSERLTRSAEQAIDHRLTEIGAPSQIESRWVQFLRKERPSLMKEDRFWWFGGRLDDRLEKALRAGQGYRPQFEMFWTRLGANQSMTEFQDHLAHLKKVTLEATDLTPMQRLRGELNLLFLGDALDDTDAALRTLDEMALRYPLARYDLYDARIAVLIDGSRFEELYELLDGDAFTPENHAAERSLLKIRVMLHLNRTENLADDIFRLRPSLRRYDLEKLGRLLQTAKILPEVAEELEQKSHEISTRLDPNFAFSPDTLTKGVGDAPGRLREALEQEDHAAAAAIAEEALDASAGSDVATEIELAIRAYAEQIATPGELAMNHRCLDFPAEFNRMVLRTIPRGAPLGYVRTPYLWALFENTSDVLEPADLNELLLNLRTDAPGRMAVADALIERFPAQALFYRPDLVKLRLTEATLPVFAKAAMEAPLLSNNQDQTRALAKLLLRIGNELIDTDQPEQAMAVWRHFLEALGPQDVDMTRSLSVYPDRVHAVDARGSGGEAIRAALLGLYEKHIKDSELVSLSLLPLTVPHQAPSGLRRERFRDGRETWWNWTPRLTCGAVDLIDHLAERGLLDAVIDVAAEELSKLPDDPYLADLLLFALSKQGAPDVASRLENHLDKHRPGRPEWYLAMAQRLRGQAGMEAPATNLIKIAATTTTRETAPAIRGEIGSLLLSLPELDLPERLAIIENARTAMEEESWTGREIQEVIPVILALLRSGQAADASRLFDMLVSRWHDEDSRIHHVARRDACIAVVDAAHGNGMANATTAAAEALLECYRQDLESGVFIRDHRHLREAMRVLHRAGGGHLMKLVELLREHRVDRLPEAALLLDSLQPALALENGDWSKTTPVAWMSPLNQSMRPAWSWGRVVRNERAPQEYDRFNRFELYESPDNLAIDLTLLVAEEEDAAMRPLAALEEDEEDGNFEIERSQTERYLRAIASGDLHPDAARQAIGPLGLMPPPLAPLSFADWKAQANESHRRFTPSPKAVATAMTRTEPEVRIGSRKQRVTRLSCTTGLRPLEFVARPETINPSQPVFVQAVSGIRLEVPQFGLRFFDESGRFVKEIVSTRNEVSPLAAWILDQIHVPLAEIPPQAASVQPFIGITSANAFIDGQVDIASAALWQIPVEAAALPCKSVRVLPAPIARVALTHSRNRVAVLLEDKQLVVIDSSGDLLASRELSAVPASIAFAGEEDAAPLCLRLHQSFLCWDWAGHGTLREILVEANNRRTAVAPDGTAVALSDAQGTLAVFTLPSLGRRWRKPVAGERASRLAFASDGKHLYLENSARAVPDVYDAHDGRMLDEGDTDAYFREHDDGPKDRFQDASRANLLEPFVAERYPAFIRLLDPQGTPVAGLSTIELGAIAEVWTVAGEKGRVHLLSQSGILYHWEPDTP